MQNGDGCCPTHPRRASNPIQIEGATEINGIIGWTPDQKISDVFRDLESDLTPQADRDLELIVRRINSLNDIEVLPFSLDSGVSQKVQAG